MECDNCGDPIEEDGDKVFSLCVPCYAEYLAWNKWQDDAEDAL